MAPQSGEKIREVAFRKKLYRTLGEMQACLDEFMTCYNSDYRSFLFGHYPTSLNIIININPNPNRIAETSRSRRSPGV